MFPDRQSRSFLDPRAIARLAAVPALCPLADAGERLGAASQPAPRGSSVEFAEYRKYVPGDDLRRLDWRAYGRSDRFYVKEFEADTNLRCCLVLDTSGSMDFGSDGRRRRSSTPAGSPGRSSYLAVQQGDAVGLSCVAGRHGPEHSAPPQPGAPDARLRRPRTSAARRARRSSSPVLHELAETIRAAGPDRHHLGSVRRARAAAPLLPASAVSQARRGRRSTCSIRASCVSISAGRCGFSTWRAARRSSPSPTTSPTATTRRIGALPRPTLQAVTLELAIDYHRVSLDEDYEQVLMRFLVGRTRTRGAAMSFLQPFMLLAPCRWSPCRSSST